MLINMKDVSENYSTGNAQPENPYKIRILKHFPQQTVEKEKDFHNLRNWLETLISAPAVDELWKEKKEPYTGEKANSRVRGFVATNGGHCLKKMF